MQKTYLAVLVGALIVAVAVPEAAAQQVEDGTITIIQPKPVLRRNRLQLTPRIGTTINDAMLRQWTIGGSLAFNLSERVFIAGVFEQFDFGDSLGGTTREWEETINVTQAVPEVAPLFWMAGLDVGFVPLYGKAVIFNKAIGYFDTYISAGVGAIDSSSGIHVGGNAAVGLNLYFNRWLGLNTEFRNRMSVEELPTQGRSFTNTVTATAGLTILMPFNFNYTYAGAAQ